MQAETNQPELLLEADEGNSDEGDDFVVDFDEAEAADVETSVQAVNRPKHRLSISGNGLTLERDVDDSTALQIIQLVLTGSLSDIERRGGDRQAPASPNQRSSDGRRLALSEYYRDIGPKQFSEKLTVIAAYLQEFEGKQSFTSDELKGRFRSVNEPAPKNMPRDFKTAMGAGWIAEEPDSPGQYYVTQSGLDAVAAKFSSDSSKKTSKTRRRRRTAKSPVAGALFEQPSDAS